MSDQITPPARWHQMLEGRVGAEASVLMMQLPLLRMQTATGTGPVMVLPGFMADDASTWLLRRFLGSLGYEVMAWGQGLNRGPMMAYLPTLIAKLEDWLGEQGEKPTLVGWSRGGTLAREIAREPMKDYLRSAAGLIKQYAWAFPAFKKPKGVNNAFELDLGVLSEEELDAILEFAFLRYFEDSGLALLLNFF